MVCITNEGIYARMLSVRLFVQILRTKMYPCVRYLKLLDIKCKPSVTFNLTALNFQRNTHMYSNKHTKITHKDTHTETLTQIHGQTQTDMDRQTHTETDPPPHIWTHTQTLTSRKKYEYIQKAKQILVFTRMKDIYSLFKKS